MGGRGPSALRLRALTLALLACAALGCGRIGLRLAPASGDGDSGRGGDNASAGEGASGAGVGGGGGDPDCMGITCACADGSARVGGGVCGCGSDADATDDSDADGVPDCIDACPREPDHMPDGLNCGCDEAAADRDGDGVSNCDDLCPFDADKSQPGSCGCGNADTDTDSDATADCHDECPNDANKVRPGVCGCGSSDTDTDLDGTPDCMDVCSGADDSGYVSDRACGVGHCQTNNQPSSCMAGIETACRAGSPLGTSDATCDGIDDDCDGKTDENFASTASSCGEGACKSTGSIRCVAAETRDSCTIGTPLAPNDATCDDVDDDCDGKLDEDVAPMTTQCATGACLAMGSLACVKGELVDSCSATDPISSVDTTCDNVDDNCNGAIDEGFVSTTSHCGTGACARTGTLTCVSGATRDSCAAGAPAANDATCDGQDDDCDGRTDENYAASASSCGVGACASSGVRSCSGGMVSDTCVPKPPAAHDDAFSPGNGVDDNCDGATDEEVPACDTTTLTFTAGSYTVSIPGNCHAVTVRLWGGGGSSGGNGIASAASGGAGGYATTTFTALTNGRSLQLLVGKGGQGCGTSIGTSSNDAYNGGAGGTSDGGNGSSGAGSSSGGSGANPTTGGKGGNGYNGGGGGGAGRGLLLPHGNGGAGGAATVLLVDGTAQVVAGGGGGGGGGGGLPLDKGGQGGSGCNGSGSTNALAGGGGGGGGLCSGTTTQAGSGDTPAFSSDIPSGTARGAAAACKVGGDGYAIVKFSP